jgi:hypothetical protein
MITAANANEVDTARRTAIACATERGGAQPAAFMVVDTAQQVLNDQQLQSAPRARSRGEQQDQGESARPWKGSVPPQVLAAVAARDEYIQRCPARRATRRGERRPYAFQSADFLPLRAVRRGAQALHPIYTSSAARAVGLQGVDRLTTGANLDNNIEESRRLAESRARSCGHLGQELAGKTADRNLSPAATTRRVRLPGREDARRPRSQKQWRESAALYQVALKNAPGRDEAPRRR